MSLLISDCQADRGWVLPTLANQNPVDPFKFMSAPRGFIIFGTSGHLGLIFGT